MFQLVVFIAATFAQGVYSSPETCGLDPKVNANTWTSYLTEVGFIFESACGRNRGIFVTNPPDGHTYNCAKFPEIWNVTDANGIKKINDPVRAVETLDKFISSVYFSTPQYVKDKDPGSCDFEAMSALTCELEQPWKTAPWADKIGSPIRSVNLEGLFVLERWVLSGLIEWGNETGIVDHLTFSEKCESLSLCERLQNHWNFFYDQSDFDNMKILGLNSVRIPIGYWYFGELSSVPSAPYILPEQSILAQDHPITKVIAMAKNAGLQVIIDLKAIAASTSTVSDTISTAGAVASYVSTIAAEFGLDNVLMLEIGSELDVLEDTAMLKEAVKLVRQSVPGLPVMILETSAAPSSELKDNIFINTKVFHGQTVADIASDTARADREKQFAHEKIACGFKAPLHFTTCRRAPTMVGAFSLAIDNCMPSVDPNFQDFGQCLHVEERAASPWWQRHTHSFAMRQIMTFERELGWSFTAYKLDNATEASSPSAVYWSFRMAVAAGFIDLAELDSESVDACAHIPESDYVMGDETYPPTLSPTIYYWIPPCDRIPPAPECTATPTVSPSTVNPTGAPSSEPVALFEGLSWQVKAAAFIGCVLTVAALAWACARRGGQSKNGYSAVQDEGIELEAANQAVHTRK